MDAHLSFGTGRLRFPLPGSWETSPPPEPAWIGDPLSAWREALARPVSGPSLAEAASGCRRVLLSVPDLTRPFPFGPLLPALLDALEDAGVPPAGVTAVVATGLHRPLSGDEIRAVLGPAAGRIRAVNHDPRDDLVDAGRTARNTPVSLNRRLSEADLAVSLGAAAFHFHAGFSGGPKGIVPGLAGEETIRENHLLALSGPGPSWHPACGPGKLDGNPVHEDLLEAAGRAPCPLFLANVAADEENRLLAVATGDVEKAHRRACAAFARHFLRKIETPFDAVLVSAGGSPRDVNLIQAHKAAAHAAGALKEGGTLVLVAECAEGTGHEDLPFWFGETPEGLMRLARKTARKYVQTAYAFMEKARRFDFLLLSSLPEDLLEPAGIRPVRSPGEVAAFLGQKHGDDFRGLLVEGPAVLHTGAGSGEDA